MQGQRRLGVQTPGAEGDKQTRPNTATEWTPRTQLSPMTSLMDDVGPTAAQSRGPRCHPVPSPRTHSRVHTCVHTCVHMRTTARERGEGAGPEAAVAPPPVGTQAKLGGQVGRSFGLPFSGAPEPLLG